MLKSWLDDFTSVVLSVKFPGLDDKHLGSDDKLLCSDDKLLGSDDKLLSWDDKLLSWDDKLLSLHDWLHPSDKSIKNPKEEKNTTWTMDFVKVYPLNHGFYHLNLGVYH